jgi:hypothetical protein
MLILAHSVGAWSLREAHSDINAQALAVASRGCKHRPNSTLDVAEKVSELRE